MTGRYSASSFTSKYDEKKKSEKQKFEKKKSEKEKSDKKKKALLFFGLSSKKGG